MSKNPLYLQPIPCAWPDCPKTKDYGCGRDWHPDDKHDRRCGEFCDGHKQTMDAIWNYVREQIRRGI